MNQENIFLPSEDFRAKAHISSLDQYHRMYKESVEDSASFWSKIAATFYWKRAATRAPTFNFDARKGPVSIKWMSDGVTNICYNLVDRHIEEGLADRVAYIWEGNDPRRPRSITYGGLQREICCFANALKGAGVKKGDRVAIYMPMTIELVTAMLACARIGAVHSVVFAGFSPEALSDRMVEGKCEILLTADGTYRGEKFIALKQLASKAVDLCAKRDFKVRNCIVHRNINPANAVGNDHDISAFWDPAVDVWWEDFVAGQESTCEPEWTSGEDPLFILYTSGSTGKPKGVLHTVGGYMIYSATVFKYVFDYRPEDVFFCTADLGWITGHTFNVYGSLANAATILLFDGVPFHPTPSRFWEMIDRHHVSIFYTAPTAIRSLMKYGDQHVEKCSLASLRLLGSVGEPLNPEAWHWYHRVVGKYRSPIVDTYWQSETGAPMITPLPGCTPLKPGSATFPFFGVVPAILNDEGVEIEGEGEGHLVFKTAWPGIMRTVDGDHKRFESTYFEQFPGNYTTGDGAFRDSEGYYFVTGRIDDLLNVSGHLLSTAEVESALIENPAVSETAAVSAPHPVKGESLYCFIVLKDGYKFDSELVAQLKQLVRVKIGSFAVPDTLHPVGGLPKTRSGKIMRRILRKFVRNETELGDLSTLADPTVIRELYAPRA